MSDITNMSGVISTIGIFVNQGTVAAPAWEYMCAMNARAFNITRGETTTPVVATCGPAADIQTWRSAGELDWTITGEGALELETFDFCREWIMTGKQVPMRIVMYKGDKTALVAHGFYTGNGLLLQYPAAQADANAIPTANISISKGSGVLAWTAGAPT